MKKMPPISFVLIIPVNGIAYAPRAVFVMLRFGVFVWTVGYVLKTLRLGAIYFEDGEAKTSLSSQLEDTVSYAHVLFARYLSFLFHRTLSKI